MQETERIIPIASGFQFAGERGLANYITKPLSFLIDNVIDIDFIIYIK